MEKRKLFPILLKEAQTRKISIILGPRQVGKTTILKAMHQKIGGLFLDLDILENFEKVNLYTQFLNTLKLGGYKPEQKKMFYVFLDEFQRYENLSLIMKNVYDNHENIKIYATGSSCLKIKEQVQESLAGRKNIHHLFPLDFEEFLWFKKDDEAIIHHNNIIKLKDDILLPYQLKKLLHEYLVYGGYPEVVLMPVENKIKTLRSIFDLYVKKELVGYLKLGRILGVKKLIEYLAINNGQKIKYEEAAFRCSLKQYEVKEYVEILEETYLVKTIRPFFTNKNKEIVKIPKIYFIDNGVRNFFINNFNEMQLRIDSGFLFEGFINQELMKAGYENIKFWQDKQKHEVDFIIDLVRRQIPIEVKYKETLKQEDYRGLYRFLEEYSIKEGYLINMGKQQTKQNIHCILPFSIKKVETM